MDSSESDETVSLNSTDDESGGDFELRDVLAERRARDGSREFLVSWVGYPDRSNSWIPPEFFNQFKESMQDWALRKQKVKDGLLPAYDWRKWEERREARLEKRELLRSNARRRGGKWEMLPDAVTKRSRNQSHDSDYSEAESDDQRKRIKISSSSSSDSEDDIPLLVKRPDKSKGPVQRKALSTIGQSLDLPLRLSPSPFHSQGSVNQESRTTNGSNPTQPSSVKATTTKSTIDKAITIKTNQKDSSSAADHSRLGKTKPAAKSSLPSFKKIPAAQPTGSAAKRDEQETVLRKISVVPTANTPVRRESGAVSSNANPELGTNTASTIQSTMPGRPSLTKLDTNLGTSISRNVTTKVTIASTARPKQTARRPVVEKNQHMFITTNRTARGAKPRMMSTGGALANIPRTDTFKNASKAWAVLKAGRDEPAPDIDQLHLVPIQNAATPNMSTSHMVNHTVSSPMTPVISNTPLSSIWSSPKPLIERLQSPNLNLGIHDNVINECRTQIPSTQHVQEPHKMPFIEGTPEPSLFVDDTIDASMSGTDEFSSTANALSTSLRQNEPDFVQSMNRHSSTKIVQSPLAQSVQHPLWTTVKSPTLRMPPHSPEGLIAATGDEMPNASTAAASDIRSHLSENEKSAKVNHTTQSRALKSDSFHISIPKGPKANSSAHQSSALKSDAPMCKLVSVEAANRCSLKMTTSGKLQLPEATHFVVAKGLSHEKHHDLLRTGMNYHSRLYLNLEEHCPNFDSFLAKYHVQEEAKYFTAGWFQNDTRHIHRRDGAPLYITKQAWVGKTPHFSILVWPASSPAWVITSKTYIGNLHDPSILGFIMFESVKEKAVASNGTILGNPSTISRSGTPISHPPNVTINPSTEAPLLTVDDDNENKQRDGLFNQSTDNRAPIPRIITEKGQQAITLLVDSSEDYTRKEAMWTSLYAQSEIPIFSDGVTDEQKARFYHELLSLMKKQTPDSTTIHPPKRVNTTERSQDPRMSRRGSVAAQELIPDQAQPPPVIRTSESFENLAKAFYSHQPLTRDPVLQFLKQQFQVDWPLMVQKRDKTEHYDSKKVPVCVHYPKDIVQQEYKLIWDALHAMDVRSYRASDHEDWESFSRGWAHQTLWKDAHGHISPAKPADDVVKVYGGPLLVLLVHKSISIAEMFARIRYKHVKNPNFRMYRISLGEAFQDRHAITQIPQPGVEEVAKAGHYVLFLDSAFLNHPEQCLRILKYIMMKVRQGDSIMYKAFARPGLVGWLRDLAQNEDHKTTIYGKLLLIINELVPEAEREHRYGGVWSPAKTASLELPLSSALVGYGQSVGLDLDHHVDAVELQMNDEKLVRWFNHSIQSKRDLTRFSEVLLGKDDPKQIQQMFDKYPSLGFLTPFWFIESWVKTAETQERWLSQGNPRHR